MSNLAETLNGRVVIRAMACEGYFIKRHQENVDLYTRMDYTSQSLLNWGNLAGGYVAFLVATACSIMCVLWAKDYEVEQLGLALTYCFLVPMFASWIGQLLNMLMMMFTSLERLVEYNTIPQEAARTTPADGSLPAGWPVKGELRFEAAVLRYRPELPPAIKSLTLIIPGGAHIGIVGRTGAGKSSIMSLLFRLVEASGGCIKIDGIDIATLGLRRLRSAINIIPQDPILLEGTVR